MRSIIYSKSSYLCIHFAAILIRHNEQAAMSEADDTSVSSRECCNATASVEGNEVVTICKKSGVSSESVWVQSEFSLLVLRVVCLEVSGLTSHISNQGPMAWSPKALGCIQTSCRGECALTGSRYSTT